MATQAQAISTRRKAIPGRLTAAITVGVVLFVAAVLFLWLSPVLATRAYLAATYRDIYNPQDVGVRLVTPGINTATVRVTAHFALDPDYGNTRPGEDGAEYRGDVQLARAGLRWLPAEGGVLSSGATYGFFNGRWYATDPQVEAARGADEPCG